VSEYVDYQVADGIATLTMDDGKANAFGVGMTSALSEGLDRAADEADVAVIMGKPGLFCAGFDLKVINGPKDGVRAMVEAGGELLMKAYMHPQPLIMGCTGHAVAAGALLLCTADYRIGVSGDFRIGLNETSIGLGLPTFGIELARDRLDNRQLNNATMGAQLYSPDSAAEVGYLDEAVPAEAFEAAIAARAAYLKTLDGPAYAQVKQRLRCAREALIRSRLQPELDAR
jgi:enoyl-CoA hydratase